MKEKALRKHSLLEDLFVQNIEMNTQNGLKAVWSLFLKKIYKIITMFAIYIQQLNITLLHIHVVLKSKFDTINNNLITENKLNGIKQ